MAMRVICVRAPRGLRGVIAGSMERGLRGEILRRGLAALLRMTPYGTGPSPCLVFLHVLFFPHILPFFILNC